MFFIGRCLPQVGGHFFMENKGYVYILTNPCFKENWIKIGNTDHLERRLAELSQATGIPLPFETYAVLETVKYKQAEHMIHKLIGKLAPNLRINPKREFFNIEPEDAVSIMQEIASLIDDAKILYYNNSQDKPQKLTKDLETQGSKRKMSPVKTFYSLGLKNGDEIEFIPNNKYKAIVNSNRTVIFEEQEYFLTTLATTLLKRENGENASAIGSGFEMFKCTGENESLYTKWYKLNKK